MPENAIPGLTWLERIIDVFERHDDPDLWEAKTKLARLKRYEPSCDHDEVTAAYRSAFESALNRDLEEDELEDDDGTAKEAIEEWVGYAVSAPLVWPRSSLGPVTTFDRDGP